MKRLTGFAALLLALLLPLQGFALSCDAAPAAPAEHCAGHHPGAPNQAAHHDCGACCCMAVATAPAPLIARRARTAATLPAPRLAAQRALLSDRLDRPPRA